MYPLNPYIRNEMAEFCSQCSPFDEWDYDLAQIALKLKRDDWVEFLCEGCNIRGVYKDAEGKLFLAKYMDNKIVEVPVNLEDLVKT